MRVKRALVLGGLAAAAVLVSRRSVRRSVRSGVEDCARIIALLPATRDAVEWDYAGLLGLIAAWCDRAARHQSEHQLVDGWKRTAREQRYAAALCRRLIAPPYLASLGYMYGGSPEPARVTLRNAGIGRIADAQHEADFQALMTLLRRKLRTWWD